MIKTRTRKILRDVWSRKARTMLVSVSIFIGVFGTVALFTMGDLLVDQLRADLAEDSLAMVRTYVAVPPGAELDEQAALDTLAAMPGAEAVEGMAYYAISWQPTDSADDGFNNAYAISYSDEFDDLQIEPPRLLDGRYPIVGSHEIAVERRFADKYDLQIGDDIMLRMLSQAGATDGPVPEERWTITGIAFYPYPLNQFDTSGPEKLLIVNYADAQAMAGIEGFTTISARFVDFPTADAASDAFTQTVAAETAYIPVFTQTEDPAENSQIEFAQTTSTVMASLALIALIVSGFLVLNVIMAIVTEQKKQIGTMKSLGATTLDNFFMYTGMSLVYGVIGVIPGVLLGIPVGFLAAQGLAESSNTIIEDFAISERAVLFGILMGLAVPVIASLLPVVGGTRVSIRDALTDFGISARYGQGGVSRGLERLPVPINVRQGISNVVRKKWRMAFTTLTLTMAAGAFMGVFAVFASIDQVIGDFFDTFGFHFGVATTQAEDLPAAEAIIMENYPDLLPEGVFSSISIEIDGFDKEFDPQTGPPALFANGYDPATTAYNITFAEGEGLDQNPAGVVISRPVADHVGKGVGDKLTISAGGHTGEYEIVGIARYPYDFVWFEWRELSRLAGYVDADGSPIPTSILLSLPVDDPTAADVDDVTSAINEDLLAHGITAQYSNIEAFTEQIANAVMAFRLIFNFTALLIALVGAVGLVSSLSMSVFERQKEIGVMRSIGAGSLTIITQFLTEGIFVGVIAWVIGLPISYLLSQGLIAALNFGDEYQLTYPPIAMLLGLIGTLLITFIASLWPSISAARRTVSDILRYQ